MQCFDENVPINPNGDLDKPFTLECACCGVEVKNGEQRQTHQAFHDTVTAAAEAAADARDAAAVAQSTATGLTSRG